MQRPQRQVRGGPHVGRGAGVCGQCNQPVHVASLHRSAYGRVAGRPVRGRVPQTLLDPCEQLAQAQLRRVVSGLLDEPGEPLALKQGLEDQLRQRPAAPNSSKVGSVRERNSSTVRVVAEWPRVRAGSTPCREWLSSPGVSAPSSCASAARWRDARHGPGFLLSVSGQRVLVLDAADDLGGVRIAKRWKK